MSENGIELINLTPHLIECQIGLADQNMHGMAGSLKAEVQMRLQVPQVVAAFVGMVARNVEPYAHARESVPLDWWQAFRERWFPAWWLNNRPVKTREIVSEWYRMCPHVAVPWTPSDRVHLRWLGDRPNDAAAWKLGSE